ncbi:MAG: hypothetical protein H7Y13_06920 [Sphingobacteriaceae bacterium]|nr:hypothetical protein [Sphingobacteriaceae bacterium]
MRDEQKLREEIEATLNSLEGIQCAEPSYYFKSKLITRLENKTAKKSSWLFPHLARPSIAIAVLLVFLILNVVTISSLLRQKNQRASSTELQSFAQEYNLGTTTLYDTNTIK